MLSCMDDPGDSPRVPPWGQGQWYMEMVMVHLSRTRIWRDCRSVTKPYLCRIVTVSSFAGCSPKNTSISIKRHERRVDKQMPDPGDFITGAGEASERLCSDSSACCVWPSVGGTDGGTVQAVNDGPNNLQLVSNQAVEANDVAQRA